MYWMSNERTHLFREKILDQTRCLSSQEKQHSFGRLLPQFSSTRSPSLPPPPPTPHHRLSHVHILTHKHGHNYSWYLNRAARILKTICEENLIKMHWIHGNDFTWWFKTGLVEEELNREDEFLMKAFILEIKIKIAEKGSKSTDQWSVP